MAADNDRHGADSNLLLPTDAARPHVPVFRSAMQRTNHAELNQQYLSLAPSPPEDGLRAHSSTTESFTDTTTKRSSLVFSNTIEDDIAASAELMPPKRGVDSVFSRFCSWMTDTWWPEILGLAFSASCIVAIAGLLLPYTFNHQPVPQFSGGLTLNVLISVLAAASKSSLIFSVAATMSQAKWCWFRPAGDSGPRRLEDMQTLDDASRGPLGSVVALFRQTLLSICSIGAVIVILALAFEPFLQQLLSYPSELVEVSTDAITLQAPVVSDDYFYSSVMTGLYGKKSSFSRTPSCSSGNCTWPLFHSTGWCGDCGPTPVQYLSNGCNLPWEEYARSGQNTTLKCALDLAGATDFPMDLEVDMLGDGGATFSLVYPALWSLTLNSTSRNFSQYLDGDLDFLARKSPMMAFAYALPGLKAGNFSVPVTDWLEGYACTLNPCSRQYNISVQNGQTSETVVSEDWGVMTHPPPGLDLKITDVLSYCWRPTEFADDDLTYDPAIYEDDSVVSYSFYVNTTQRSWCTEFALSGLLDFLSVFNGTMTYNSDYRWFAPNDTGLSVVGSATSLTPENALLFDALWLNADGLKSVMPNVLASLTYGNTHAGGSATSNYSTAFHGSVMAERTFVRVRWEWMILPVLLIALDVVFLAVIMYDTRRLRLPLWKTSVMAMLYHGLDRNLIEPDEPYESASGMADAARRVYVRLGSMDDSGGRTFLRG